MERSFLPWAHQHVANVHLQDDDDSDNDPFHTACADSDDEEASFDTACEELSDNELFQSGGSFDDGDQETTPSYRIETIRERKIPKFQVQGFDYRVRVESFDRNLPFAQAVRNVHAIIESKMIFYVF